jgi:predicted glycosyltransferase
MLREKPDLTLSHGSRAQLLAGRVLRVPNTTIHDYKFTAKVGSLRPDWLFSPSYIPHAQSKEIRRREMKYPGLKEDVYVPRFRPDPLLKGQLGLNSANLAFTVRPPATEAHYHNSEAEVLFDAALNMFTQHLEVCAVLLPRNEKQEESLRKQWKEWIDRRKIIIPSHVVDGLNLIWHSDLVVSSGGTMNREAAALSVPVYSVFRGRIGASINTLQPTAAWC